MSTGTKTQHCIGSINTEPYGPDGWDNGTFGNLVSGEGASCKTSGTRRIQHANPSASQWVHTPLSNYTPHDRYKWVLLRVTHRARHVGPTFSPLSRLYFTISVLVGLHFLTRGLRISPSIHALAS